ncbi:MAG TPA: hypothetical protein VME21_04565, partial [Steroidobacteraceae bacterium]|nr:hypothetical protein [Steroidobacteraceae bacterium]
SWASHEDTGPYHGWVLGYQYSATAAWANPLYVYCDTPNGAAGGIWMSGGAPAFDSSGNLYLITGNGTFDANETSTPNTDFGDSLLQLSSTLSEQQYFTPSDQATDAADDKDFGAGGATVLVDLPSGSPVTHLVMGGGKDGNLYILNRDALGGYDDGSTPVAWQEITGIGGLFATGAYWNDEFYIVTASGSLRNYQLSTSTGMFSLQGTATSPASYGWPGASPSVSSSGTGNGIVWALGDHLYCTAQASGCGPSVLYAYDATNVGTQLYNSSMASADAAGNAVKFTVPTVANGKVYVGTRGNNTGGAESSTSTPGELDVYGLLPSVSASSAVAHHARRRVSAPAAAAPAQSTPIPTHRSKQQGVPQSTSP